MAPSILYAASKNWTQQCAIFLLSIQSSIDNIQLIYVAQIQIFFVRIDNTRTYLTTIYAKIYL